MKENDTIEERLRQIDNELHNLIIDLQLKRNAKIRRSPKWKDPSKELASIFADVDETVEEMREGLGRKIGV